MKLNEIHSAYFVGIGGVGMSALARYLLHRGVTVSGYDRVKNSLCTQMEELGIDINYRDEESAVPEAFLNAPKTNALVVYTPAIPATHKQYNLLRQQGFHAIKRSELLGLVSKTYKTIAVAGTHGKTTTSAMIAHILTESGLGCNAFLGGVSSNYNSNLLLSEETDYAVLEADEYDRSFLTLHPNWAVVTSMDPDHLDIYSDAGQMTEAFCQFAGQIEADGLLIAHGGLNDLKTSVSTQSYGLNGDEDIYADNIRVDSGAFFFDLNAEGQNVPGIQLGLPGRHNVENALAAAGIAFALRIDAEVVRKALGSFKGVKRRFEMHINRPEMVYIDDYAHHPTEIDACIGSVREMFPGRRITGVFQPHLFSRTRDFANEFAAALSKLDEVILLEIYPAREEPIEGISSEMLLEMITAPKKLLLAGEEMVERMRENKTDVLLTMGAGDIDQFVEPLKKALLL